MLAKGFQMIPGKGIKAEVNGQQLLCGNPDFIREHQILIDEAAAMALDRFYSQGKAVVLVAYKIQLVSAVTLSDTLREASGDVITELKKAHTHVVLLTGDHEQAARYFAGQAGIHDIRAGLLPAQKAEEIQRLQKEGRNICMIGDGVNDAPALKTAHVGVAMGSMGSDIAVDSADIALMGDDISKIPYLKRLSNEAGKTIKLSICLSLCINFAAIFLSIAGVLTPTTGALVHNGGSIFVVLIAARLYDRRFINEKPNPS